MLFDLFIIKRFYLFSLRVLGFFRPMAQKSKHFFFNISCDTKLNASSLTTSMIMGYSAYLEAQHIDLPNHSYNFYPILDPM